MCVILYFLFADIFFSRLLQSCLFRFIALMITWKCRRKKYTHTNTHKRPTPNNNHMLIMCKFIEKTNWKMERNTNVGAFAYPARIVRLKTMCVPINTIEFKMCCAVNGLQNVKVIHWILEFVKRWLFRINRKIKLCS